MNRSLLAFLLLLITVASVAQKNDSTDNAGYIERPPLKPDPSVPTSSQPRLPAYDEPKSVNPLVRIRMDAIPRAMHNALQDEKYKGWEQSPVYRNNETSEYSIDIRNGDSTKTYSFDRFGNPVEP